MSACADAWIALRLFARCPAPCGGIIVRAAAGPVRDLWLADLRAALPASRPLRMVPAHVESERLLGGLDLASTLQLGRPVAQRGLLAESDGGVVVLAMAERAAPGTVALIAAALDCGEVVVARDGIEQRSAARIGVVALDESTGDDAPCSDVLLDRLAFVVDLRDVPLGEAQAIAAAARLDEEEENEDPSRPTAPHAERGDAAAPSSRLESRIGDELVEALCAAALALGVRSLRACILATRVARARAGAEGRADAGTDDAQLAARLVLAPRATQAPASLQPQEARDDEDVDASPPPADASEPRSAIDDNVQRTDDDASPPADGESESPPADGESTSPPDLDDLVLAAAVAALPAGLLARLASLERASARRASAGRAGAVQAGQRRGRPQGVRRARPQGGARLDLIATLRAAAPWQTLRGRARAEGGAPWPGPLRLRADDFHVKRLVQHGHTTTIFAVDASGSSALHRLAEAKGAVELLLAECYVRRDSVAVIAFRGTSSDVLLPPTRSLVRAKRSLAELAGGGGTPLASGLDAAAALALAVRRRGDSPVVVVLTDGRANIGRDGKPGRAAAEADALNAARALGAAGFSVLLVDTSPQPQPRARELAAAMHARYLPLPHAGAEALSGAVRTAAA